MRLKSFSVLVFVGFVFAGCGKPNQNVDSATKEPDSASEETPPTPEELPYVEAAKPFASAIAARQYDRAYALLSRYATAQMSLNQFSPEDDQTKFTEREKNPEKDVTVGRFHELMGKAEERFGMPRSVKNLSVYTTDPKELDRRGKQNLDAVDAMLAVGMIPDSVPAAIRRASLRGKIVTQLSPQEMEKVAKEQGMTVSELEINPDFEPYFTIKIVLIEEDRQLKIGYFEFLPPGIMD